MVAGIISTLSETRVMNDVKTGFVRHRQVLAAIAILSASVTQASAYQATGERGMVASVHPLATDAGLAVLKDGGNAVDAAIATALMLGVVDNHNSGVGGGCFILIRTAEGKLVAIDGRETAPAAAFRDLYLRDGEPQTNLSQTGPLAVGTPGAFAAYDLALRQHGSRSLKSIIEPAAKTAAEGFEISGVYARVLRSKAEMLARFEGSRDALLKPDGTPYEEGEVLKQPDLARTYRNVGEHGIEWFYEGEFAERVAAWMKENDGILTAEDFAEYRPRLREPIITNYRDYQVVGFPPPSSGGVHVAQMLNMLEHYDLKKMADENPAQMTHVVGEVMKLAFADRAHWLGDSDFVNVPKGLIDPAYARELVSRIDLEKTIEVKSHGTPPRADDDFFTRHTTHLTAVDAQGNWVAITQTVNTSFGSKVIVPGTGVVLNNEMDDFSIAPGVANAFGLVGAEANAVEAFKRPLSSMSPTIVLKDGEPVLTCGAAGGPKIITQVLLTIIRHLDLGMPIEDALAKPRFHHQWSPDRLLIESNMNETTQASLEASGHTLYPTTVVGITQAISRTPDGKGFVGAHDPRIPGKAAGY